MGSLKRTADEAEFDRQLKAQNNLDVIEKEILNILPKLTPPIDINKMEPCFRRSIVRISNTLLTECCDCIRVTNFNIAKRRITSLIAQIEQEKSENMKQNEILKAKLAEMETKLVETESKLASIKSVIK